MAESNLIGRQFGRQTARYGAVSGIQFLLAAKLWESLAPQLPLRLARILDVGTGTGHLVLRLAQAKPAQIHLLDLAPEMLAEARARLQAESDCAEIYLHQANAELWKPKDEMRPFDLLASSAAVQWFDDLNDFCVRAAEWIRPGGLVALATFGPRTLSELGEAYLRATGKLLNPGTHMVSREMLQSNLAHARLRILALDSQISFTTHNSPMAVLRDLKSMGVTGANSSQGLTRSNLVRLETELQRSALDPSGKVRCTWELVWAVAQKI